jgi:hypothetical protein
MIRMAVDTSAVHNDLVALKTGAHLALARAINRTANSVKTVMTRAVATSLRVKQAYVRDRIKVRLATRAALSATITASANPIPVLAQGARGPEPSRGQGRGVTANTPQRRYPHAFIATMPSGHRGVFQREGRKRLKIKELTSASVAAVFIHHERAGQARADEQLPKNVTHEVEHLLRTTARQSGRQRRTR